MHKPKIGQSRYISELERRCTSLEYKCKTQEAVIERLSKNYYQLRKARDKVAMDYWMYWFKMDEETAEALEDKGWYLIIAPDCDHPVVAQYIGSVKGFQIEKTFDNRIIQIDLIRYWTELPEPDLIAAFENKEDGIEKQEPTKEAETEDEE